jgi:hypothetical protein
MIRCFYRKAETVSFFQDADGPFFSMLSRLLRQYVCIDKYCRLAECGYDGLVIGAENHLDVAGRCWHVGDVLAEENGRPISPLATPPYMLRWIDVAEWMDVWNVHAKKQHDVVFAKQVGKLRKVCASRKPSEKKLHIRTQWKETGDCEQANRRQWLFKGPTCI